MVWICLGLASGTCDFMALVLVMALVAFVLAAAFGLFLSFLAFIIPGLDGIVEGLIKLTVVSFFVFFIGGLIYLG